MDFSFGNFGEKGACVWVHFFEDDGFAVHRSVHFFNNSLHRYGSLVGGSGYFYTYEVITQITDYLCQCLLCLI